jgi:hypothetical protein
MQRYTTIIFILLLFFQFSEKYSFSQKHPQLQTIGINAGPGLYGITGVEFYDEYDKNISFHVTPLVNFSLSDRVLICTGLGYELKGAPDKIFDYNTRLSYLVLPVYGKYLFNKSPRFYALAGIYGGYLIGATKKGSMKLGPDETRINENVISDFRRMDLGLTAGAGYMIRLNFDLDFFVEVKTNIGVLNIGAVDGFKPKNYGYSLSLGYLYYIGFR